MITNVSKIVWYSEAAKFSIDAWKSLDGYKINPKTIAIKLAPQHGISRWYEESKRLKRQPKETRK
jgi:hypothetical protein